MKKITSPRTNLPSQVFLGGPCWAEPHKTTAQIDPNIIINRLAWLSSSFADAQNWPDPFANPTSSAQLVKNHNHDHEVKGLNLRQFVLIRIIKLGALGSPCWFAQQVGTDQIFINKFYQFTDFVFYIVLYFRRFRPKIPLSCLII